MKRIFLILTALALCLTCLTATAEEDPRRVTVREWLDAKGEAGDCELEVEIQAVLNPVLAIVGDETGTVNLFGLTFYDRFYGFGENFFLEGDRIVIRNPRYNVFDGNVEMSDSQLVAFRAAGTEGETVFIKDWLEAKGQAEGSLYVKVMGVENPVLARVADETGEISLFLIRVNGEEQNFIDCGLTYGDLLVLTGAEYNEYEGTVEMKSPELIRRVSPLPDEEG